MFKNKFYLADRTHAIVALKIMILYVSRETPRKRTLIKPNTRITEQRLILTVNIDKKERFQQICYQILIIFVEHSHSLFYT